MHVHSRGPVRALAAGLAVLAIAVPATSSVTAAAVDVQATASPDPAAASATPTPSDATAASGGTTSTPTVDPSAPAPTDASPSAAPSGSGASAGSSSTTTNDAAALGGDATGSSTSTNTNANANTAVAAVTGSGNSTNTISAAGVGNPSATATGASANVGSISIAMPPLTLSFPPEFLALLRTLLAQQQRVGGTAAVSPAVVAASGPARMIDVPSMRAGAAVVTVPVNRPIKLMLRGLPVNGSYQVLVPGSDGAWTSLGWRTSVSRMVLTPGFAALRSGPSLLRIDRLTGRDLYVLLSART